MLDNNIKSDAEWYCREDSDRDLYLGIFFNFCKKYEVNYSSATDKEKAFIDEICRVTFEKEIAKKKGISLDSVKGFFAA